MKNSYTLQFGISTQSKLKVMLFFDNKLQKCKTFPILVTKTDLRDPSPALDNMLMGIKKRWNDLIIANEESGKSPIKLMFETKYAETKSPYEFFKQVHDYRLKRWMAFIDKDLSWADLDDQFLTDYKEFLASEDVSTNTIRAYLTGLKKSLDDAKMRGYKITSKRYAEILKSASASSISIYLTMDELKKLEDVDLPKKWNDVRVKFLIGAYSGARYSDYSKLTTADISSGEIKYISEKTGTLAYVPIHKKLAELLGRYKSDISNSQMNVILPKIARMAGITEMVSVVRGDVKEEGEKCEYVKSHTARRTFATNLSKEGVDILDISRMLGHKSVTTTAGYIASGINSVKLKEFKYFNN